MLTKEIVKNMKPGDILYFIFGERNIDQASLTCTKLCGFKHYIFLGNALSTKIFFEGNSDKEEEDNCYINIVNYANLVLPENYGEMVNIVFELK